MKKSRLLSAALALVVCLALLPPARAIESMDVRAGAAILIDANHGDVLYEKNAHQTMYPASITKVMTALLVIEAIEAGQLSQDQLITASQTALAGLSIYGSTQNIQVGEQMSVTDLLYCLLVPSANEAANILAEAVSGDIPTFVEAMNQRAQELGCEGTHFANPHGLHDPNHYTTAYDISLFTREAMTHDLFRTIVSTTSYTTQATNMSQPRLFYNTNALLSQWHYLGQVYSKAIGVKTGTTDEAGRCLVSAAVDGEEYLIAVVLKADGESSELLQFSESSRLLEWGFQSFERRTISLETSAVGKVEVTLSSQSDEVLLTPQGSVTVTLPSDVSLDDIEKEIIVNQESVEAPVSQGQVLGSMVLRYDGQELGKLDLVAMSSVERSELLYKKAQLEQFFSQTWVKIALAVVLLAVAALVLRLTVFGRSRRYGAGVGGGYRRGGYRGRRRR